MEDTQKELLREAYEEVKEELELQKPLEAGINIEIPRQLEGLEIINTQEELKANTNDAFVVEEIPKNIEKSAQTDINILFQIYKTIQIQIIGGRIILF